MIEPGRAMRAQGYPVTLAPPPRTDRRTGKEIPAPPRFRLRPIMVERADGEHVVGIADRPDCDVLVIQRPLSRLIAQVIPHLQAAGVAVVIEIDDDFHAIHRGSVAWPAAQPDWWLEDDLPKLVSDLARRGVGEPVISSAVMRTGDGRTWRRVLGHMRPRSKSWLAKACSIADHVIVSTPALADRYGKHGRVSVVPNVVPERYLDVKPAAWGATLPRPHVGWSGSVLTHVGDLEELGDAVRGHPLAVVGTGMGVAEITGAEVHACGWQAFESYPAKVAGLHAGLVPLAPTLFNEAKSTLKGLEYAALGVPFVASPTTPYVELWETEGLGRLAFSPEQWRVEVRRLLDDDHASEITRAREVIAERHTIEGATHLWWAAYRAAHSYRRGNPA